VTKLKTGSSQQCLQQRTGYITCAPGGQCRAWETAVRLQKHLIIAERSSWSSQSISYTTHMSKLWAGIKKVWMLQPLIPTN